MTCYTQFQLKISFAICKEDFKIFKVVKFRTKDKFKFNHSRIQEKMKQLLFTTMVMLKFLNLTLLLGILNLLLAIKELH